MDEIFYSKAEQNEERAYWESLTRQEVIEKLRVEAEDEIIYVPSWVLAKHHLQRLF